ncbi:MAG TPA: hypothetical protein PKK00_09835 [Bacteroidales bacterium]|nr:hypothetical protein [Bacteroidales bacterium]HPS17525.1 hypothetical protein [Bacteroidales bacterium]
MKKNITLLLLSFILLICLQKTEASHFFAKETNPSKSEISMNTDETIKALIAKFGDKETARIEKGVKQAASLWTDADGDAAAFKAYCLENYATGDDLTKLFNRISTNFEVLFGHFNKIGLDLKIPLHLDEGDMLPIDETFGAYDPSAHFNDDFFNNKIAFTVILNFPFYTLKEKEELGKSWSRLEWAYAKIGDVFTARVPSDLLQAASNALTAADSYIAGYNICMDKLVNDKMKTLFPADLKLITHWGLRDELKSQYAEKDGLEKQKMIYEVMKKIISQEIPVEVINKKDYLWNPITNKLYKGTKEVAGTPEKNERYQMLLNNFKAVKAIDKYSPQYPTYIQRAFDRDMQLSQASVEKIFVDFMSSPTVKKVATLISKRLKRKLQPFDIWYDGFKSRSTISQSELDSVLRIKYPTKEAFAKDLPNILVKLGFTKEKAEYITSKIQVDASRGAGHAWQSDMKTEKAHLRTRVGKNGMDYKGYNIAVHEFGHNVEQTLTLYDMDYYILRSVPNTSFTEAIAFLFQQKDLELMGYKNNDVNKKSLFALDNFWSSYEIMGVSLVDMQVWKWMYEHPTATADELKAQVILIAKDVWNKYYADVFGVKDEPILAIYSHMIDAPLYLSAYPVGHLIDFQIEKYVEGKSLSTEIQRMLSSGSIVPQQWMKNAVGSEISGKALIDATDEALKNVTK